MMSKKYRNEEYLQTEYWENGKSLREIGDECGVDGGTVQYWMEKYDIPTRTPHKDKPASFYTDKKGYERSVSQRRQVGIHRLVFVAEHGFSEIDGKEVHHENDVPWDNRPSNLVGMTKAEHTTHHNIND